MSHRETERAPVRLRQTHTLVTLAVPPKLFKKIEEQLHEAGYDHALAEPGVIDMTGIGLVPGEDDETV